MSRMEPLVRMCLKTIAAVKSVIKGFLRMPAVSQLTKQSLSKNSTDNQTNQPNKDAPDVR